MGLLTPLYALAAAAVIGPILFHLIRREPRGLIDFSSLIFLRSSPPRLTRRRRLDHLRLLLLRGLAILLIALAFARPYLRQESLMDLSLPERCVAILVDVSASMKRPEIWQAAEQQIIKVLNGLTAQDLVALYSFDTGLTPIVPLDDLSEHTDAEQRLSRQSLVRDALKNIQPTWRAGSLSAGLIGLAEIFRAHGLSQNAGPANVCERMQIVLVTDFHHEPTVDSLQGYTWPEQIQLDLRLVRPVRSGNARVTLMLSDEGQHHSTDQFKVRVENNVDSADETLTLQWADAAGKMLGQPTSLQCPAGQVRVITMPHRPDVAVQIQMIGDAWTDDNTLYVPSRQPITQQVVFSGRRSSGREDDLAYFLQQAPLSTAEFRRELTILPPENQATLAQMNDIGAVIVEPTGEWTMSAQTLRTLAEQSCSVIVVLSKVAKGEPGIESFLMELLTGSKAAGLGEPLTLTEADRAQPALISFIDYRNPVFASFVDPRFNDFSKIRIWQHRQVRWPGTLENKSTGPLGMKVVAALDDGSPWLIHHQCGSGDIWLMTCGWQTNESNWALSSKFIPMLLRLIDPRSRQARLSQSVDVGQPIPIIGHPIPTVTNLLTEQGDVKATVDNQQVVFHQPGLYNIAGTKHHQQIAVHVPLAESRVTMMDTALLQQHGIGTERLMTAAESLQPMRQLQIKELEQSQRMWKWLLLVGIIVLIVETWTAGKSKA